MRSFGSRRQAAAKPRTAAAAAFFAHGVIPGASHIEALGLSSPGTDEAHLMGPSQPRRTVMEHFVGLDVSLSSRRSAFSMALERSSAKGQLHPTLRQSRHS
jgi:hypothetical protein